MADNLTRKIFKGFLWKFIVLFEPIDSESIFVLDLYLFLFIFILIFFLQINLVVREILAYW